MKVIGWIIGIVLLVAVAVGVYLFMSSGDLIKRGIETYGSQALDTRVGVDQVNLSLTEGSGEIRGLDVANPSGFPGGSAFKLGQIKVVLDTQNLSTDLVVLKEVVIDGAEVAAVVRGKETNLQQLMDNLGVGRGGAEQSSSQASGVKLIIDRLRFTNARVSVDSDLLGEKTLTIPDVLLSGIGRKTNGVTVAEATRQVLEPITRSVTRELVNQGLDIEGMQQQAEKQIKDKVQDALGSGLKGLTDKLRGSDQ
ncbi:MAG: hypothetical protein R3E86_17320 [Pseudomonadales bacterium]